MENEAAPKKCPVCEACSRGGTLLLRQINATEAIYVCDNSKCPYPVGSADLGTVLVQSPIPELIDHEDKMAGNRQMKVKVNAEQESSKQSTPATEDRSRHLITGASPYIPAVDTELDALLNSLLDDL